MVYIIILLMYEEVHMDDPKITVHMCIDTEFLENLKYQFWKLNLWI